MALTESNKTALGFPQGDFTSDRYKLCEYVDYHAGELFSLCFDGGKELWVIAKRDTKAKPVNGGLMHYSGAYFSLNGGPGKDIFSDIPDEIYLGILVDTDSPKPEFNPHKVQKIFSQGKFVGPSIYEESGMYY